LPPTTSSLSSFLPPKMTEGLGGAINSITDDAGSDSYKLMAILKSRSLAEKVIEEFSLLERFEFPTIEDAIIAFNDMVFISFNDELMIEVRVNAKTEFFHFNEDEIKTRTLAKDMCSFIISYLDSTFTELEIQKARFERIVIEKRFEQNKKELEDAQIALKKFSERTGIVAVPQQIEAAVTAAAELESKKIMSEIELSALEQVYKKNSTKVEQKRITVNQLENAIQNFTLRDIPDSLSVLPSFSESPELLYKYIKLQREVQIQNILYEFLIQQYEQVKLQETRQTPTLQFIDLPQLPTKRISPTRSVLVIALVFIATLFGVIFLIILELYLNRLKRYYKELKESSS